MQVGTLVRHYTETGWNVHGIGIVTEIESDMAWVHWTNTQACWMVVRILKEVLCK